MSPPTIIPPTDQELYSRHLARLLCYAMRMLEQEVIDWVEVASQCPYGDTNQTETMIYLLADLCVSMSQDDRAFILGNGRNPNARDLNAWWTRYQAESAPSDQAVS